MHVLLGHANGCWYDKLMQERDFFQGGVMALMVKV